MVTSSALIITSKHVPRLSSVMEPGAKMRSRLTGLWRANNTPEKIEINNSHSQVWLTVPDRARCRNVVSQALHER